MKLDLGANINQAFFGIHWKERSMSEQFNKEIAEYVRSAASALAAVCDFAEEKDNQGFSRADAPFGHAIAVIPV